MKSLDAQIDQQKVQLRYFSVFAPVDGIVGDIPVHVGDRVTNTTMLTTIDERSGLEVYLPIPSERAKDLKDRRAGARFSMPMARSSSAQRFTLCHRRWIPRHKRSWRRPRWIRPPTGFGRSNWCTLVSLGACNRVSPFQWWQYPGSADSSLLLWPRKMDGKDVARQLPLTLGEISGNDYRVISGLKPGDQVIVSGGQNLADGMPIRFEQ